MSSKKPSSGRLAVRVGRPPRKLAGEVDQRILDAARRVLFERGLTGAVSMRLPPSRAPSKWTIYARYPDKEGA
jgi:hypothetical protein